MKRSGVMGFRGGLVLAERGCFALSKANATVGEPTRALRWTPDVIRNVAAVLLLSMGLGTNGPVSASGIGEDDPCAFDRDSAACSARGGSDVNVYEEYDKRLRGHEVVSPLGSDIFGENIGLYSGATEFRVVDIDLPGNGPPVQLARRLKVEARKVGDPLGGFGAWDVDVPYVYGTFLGTSKWDTGLGLNTQRCRTPWFPQNPQDFDTKEIWSGFHIHLPGQGDREFYPRIAQFAHPVPQDSYEYHWVARDDLRLSCLTATSNGYFGEGFLAIDGEGTKYWFDVGLERAHGHVRRKVGFGHVTAPRTRVYLMASKVQDRFGNWVQYHYTGAGLGAYLTAIEGSDGRYIALLSNSNPGYPRITSASAHGRTWTYTYAEASLGAPGRHPVKTVTLPDNLSKWTYSYVGGLYPEGSDPNHPQSQFCPPPYPPDGIVDFEIAATHPAGATGTFQFRYMQHYRSGVARSCWPVGTGTNSYRLDYANYFQTFALVSKSVHGVGVPAQTWSYDYGGEFYPLTDNTLPAPCLDSALCPESKTVTVTNPDGTSTLYDFGVRFVWNDGRLLRTRTRSATAQVLRDETLTYVTEAEAGSLPFPDSIGSEWHSGSDDPGALRIRPVRSTSISQQETVFGKFHHTFDIFARPTHTSKSSSLNGRAELTTYYDNHQLWVIGQVASIQDQASGAFEMQVAFDSPTALPAYKWKFGHLVERRTYHAIGAQQAGRLWQIYDGSNVKKTTLNNYYRGIPRSVIYHDGASESALVSDHGEITSVTNAMSNTWTYHYSPLGRLNRIQYPAGDTVAWNDTFFDFEPIASVEYGLPAGHWRHTRRTGNGHTITYLDGLLRPVLTRTLDAANQASTQRMTRRAFDHANRETFVSYPQHTISAYNSPLSGSTTTYDALGRPTLMQANTELGVSSTHYAYLSGFQTRVSDPRGQITTIDYLAYDEPTTDWPVQISLPEGQTTTFARDTWGKPLTVTRSGWEPGGFQSLQRRFVYDNHQRVCKVHDPEAGWTIIDYDGSSNVAWIARGQSLVSPTDCQRANVSALARSVHSYDGRNRLIGIDHPEGTSDISHSYYADGSLWTSGASGITWTYGYTKRGLPTTETLNSSGHTLTLTRVYDINGHQSSFGYPDGSYINAFPNALGEPTQAGFRAISGVYHPNGALKSFTYGNGYAHVNLLNTRQLPGLWMDTRAGVQLVNYTHDYDASGNLTSRNDGSNGPDEDRTMVYDGLNRLTHTTAPNLLGTAAYTYDALDNVRSVNYGNFVDAPQLDTYHYDVNNRLSQIHLTDGTNNVYLPYGHDGRGNTTSRSVHVSGTLNTVPHTHTYNAVNQMTSSQVGGVWDYYSYDSHGRRTNTQRGSDTTLTLYDRDGVLRYERRPDGVGIKQIYLGRRLVASVTGTVTSYVHTDTLGSAIRRTDEFGNEIPGSRSIPEPYGTTSGATSWLSGLPGFTGHVWDASSKLHYMQQRHYDPAAMRFLSVDPVHLDATGGNFNRYWYASNNPYRYVDPDGRHPAVVAGCAKVAPCRTAVIGAGKAVVRGVTATARAIGKLFGDSPESTEETNEPPIAEDVRANEHVTPLDQEIGSNVQMAEHTSNASPKNKNKHQEGESRRQRDQGGERGDSSRRPPRKPPPDHIGPWPRRQQR
jgi:RHS repeat-associated protein